MADGVIKISTDIDDKGLKSGLSGLSSKAQGLMSGLSKAAIAGTVAAGAAVVGLVKQSVQAYSEFEQLRGGVEVLFKDSSDRMMNYANNAWKTSQMSANQYLTIATSFSAALINDLGGDYEKAADMTNKAAQTIADNWAAMGGDIGLIQQAFQGFAKQNYTMLDNLKLGYGGTKTEMERLISDANEYAKSIGEAGNLTIDSFADQITAIELIQKKLGLYGHAAEEAQHTIQGSLAMTKASWENLITGMSDSEADIQQLVANFSESFGYFIGNLVPVITQALGGIVSALAQLVPMLAEKLPEMMSSLLPMFINALMDMFRGLAEVLPSVMAPLVEVLPTLISFLIDGIIEIGPMLIEGIVNLLPSLIQAICNGLLLHIGDILNAGIQLLLALVQAIPQVIAALVNNIPYIIASIITGLLEHLPELIVGAVQLFMALIIAIPQIVVELIKAIPMIITGIVMGLITGIPLLIQTAVDLFVGFIGYIQSLPGRMIEIGGNIVRGIWDGINNMIGWVVDKIKGFGEHIIGALMGVFGIASPSKVMRDLVGINLARGIVQGFFEEDPMGQIKAGVENGLSNLSANLNVNAEGRSLAAQQAVADAGSGINLTFNDVQVSPDSIYQKFRQQATYGLARKYG